jgi:hypothetical protein
MYGAVPLNNIEMKYINTSAFNFQLNINYYENNFKEIVDHTDIAQKIIFGSLKVYRRK